MTTLVFLQILFIFRAATVFCNSVDKTFSSSRDPSLGRAGFETETSLLEDHHDGFQDGRRRRLSDIDDGNALCDFFFAVPSANQGVLSNWCGCGWSGGGACLWGIGCCYNTPCTNNNWKGVTCTNSRVTTFNLGGTSLGGFQLPATIGTLNQLTTLNLAKTGLSGNLPDVFGSFQKLKNLWLYENTLTGSVPSSLGSLPSLLRAGLNGNQFIGTLASSLCQLWTYVDFNLGSNPQLTCYSSCLLFFPNFNKGCSMCTDSPTAMPSLPPSPAPTAAPTAEPSSKPTAAPTAPSAAPTPAPSAAPTAPTPAPSAAPTAPTPAPSAAPTPAPSTAPSAVPTRSPTPRKPLSEEVVVIVISVCAVLGAMFVAWGVWYCHNYRGRGATYKVPPHKVVPGAINWASGQGVLRGVANGVVNGIDEHERARLAEENRLLRASLEMSRMAQAGPTGSFSPPAYSGMSSPGASTGPAPLYGEGEEYAWQAGTKALSTMKFGGIGADALVPGLLSIARDVPLIGPCAGILLQFYRIHKQVKHNHGAFAGLREQCDLGVGWIREMAPRLPSLQNALVEQALRRVVFAVHGAAQLIEGINYRFQSAEASLLSRALNAFVNTALSDIDQNRIGGAHAALRDSITYLLQTVPTVTGLQTNAKMEVLDSRLTVTNANVVAVGARMDAKVDVILDEMGAILGILSDYTKDAKQAQERNTRLQELMLQSSEIKLNSLIGHGGFSSVYAGIYHNNQCAVKVIKRKSDDRLSMLEKESIENELIMTRYLADPNILHCYGYVHEVDRTLVVLELAPYGSLWEMLYDDQCYPDFPFILSLGWIGDICSATAHMFSKGVKHKDIKAENCLVYAYPSRLIAKLSDFGFARKTSATMSHAGGGTSMFEAPEVRSTGKASFASDIFSIGMTGVQILTRRTPGRLEWQEQVDAAMSIATTRVERDCPSYSKALAPLHSLLIAMTDADQTRRPNALQCSMTLREIVDSLGGDPRIDRSAQDYDLLSIIEDGVKTARQDRMLP